MSKGPFKTHFEVKNCFSDSQFYGFGCWCGIDYDRVGYVVRDGMGSRVQLKDLTAGDDTVMPRSDHHINEV